MQNPVISTHTNLRPFTTAVSCIGLFVKKKKKKKIYLPKRLVARKGFSPSVLATIQQK